MRFLETRVVSRKTPGDGRLEITRETAGHLEPLGERVPVLLNGEPLEATLGTLPCTCRGDETPHVHYFLQAEQFRELDAGSRLDIEMEAGERIHLRHKH